MQPRPGGLRRGRGDPEWGDRQGTAAESSYSTARSPAAVAVTYARVGGRPSGWGRDWPADPFFFSIGADFYGRGLVGWGLVGWGSRARGLGGSRALCRVGCGQRERAEQERGAGAEQEQEQEQAASGRRRRGAAERTQRLLMRPGARGASRLGACQRGHAVGRGRAAQRGSRRRRRRGRGRRGSRSRARALLRRCSRRRDAATPRPTGPRRRPGRAPVLGNGRHAPCGTADGCRRRGGTHGQAAHGTRGGGCALRRRAAA